MLRVADLSVYPDRYEVFLGDDRLDVTVTQFRILRLLAQHPGTVLSPTRIAKALIHEGIEIEPLAIKNHIYAIRRQLGDAGAMIRNVRGVGYGLDDRFKPTLRQTTSPSGSADARRPANPSVTKR